MFKYLEQFVFFGAMLWATHFNLASVTQVLHNTHV